MRRIFISDLHLDETLTKLTSEFFNFLKNECKDCDELYILGDLFNYWISDRENTPYQQEVAMRIAEVPAKKYFIQGNRDFLLGKKYCKRCGMKLLPDHTAIQLNEHSNILLCHGDSLCTLDYAYQSFRKFRSNKFYRFLYALLPMSTKRQMANSVRTNAMSEKKLKHPEVMDVVAKDFIALMEQYNCKFGIHGHTHKPNVHLYNEQNMTRYVLGDWTESGFFYVEEKNGVLKLIRKSFDKH